MLISKDDSRAHHAQRRLVSYYFLRSQVGESFQCCDSTNNHVRARSKGFNQLSLQVNSLCSFAQLKELTNERSLCQSMQKCLQNWLYLCWGSCTSAVRQTMDVFRGNGMAISREIARVEAKRAGEWQMKREETADEWRRWNFSLLRCRSKPTKRNATELTKAI